MCCWNYEAAKYLNFPVFLEMSLFIMKQKTKELNQHPLLVELAY